MVRVRLVRLVVRLMLMVRLERLLVRLLVRLMRYVPSGATARCEWWRTHGRRRAAACQRPARRRCWSAGHVSRWSKSGPWGAWRQ
jgi:hypothetical protein